MLNIQALLPVLKRSLPNSTDSRLIEAIKKFENAHPNFNESQFLAAMQMYMKQKQSRPLFQGLMNNVTSSSIPGAH